MSDLYLQHYGVKGMKWGVRRDSSVLGAKAAYKQAKVERRAAKKAYNQSFKKAYNRSIGAYSPVKRHRQNAEDRWNDALNKADNLRNAKKNVKTAKANYKATQNEAANRKYGELNAAKTAHQKARNRALGEYMLLGMPGYAIKNGIQSRRTGTSTHTKAKEARANYKTARSNFKTAKREAAVKRQGEIGEAKAAYKQAKSDQRAAKKAYNKSFNNAYNRSIGALSPVKRHRQNAEDRWSDALDKAVASRDARMNTRAAKANYKAVKRRRNV